MLFRSYLSFSSYSDFCERISLSNNQMRDIFIDEIEIEDTDQFVRDKFKGKDVTFDRTDLEDGTIIYDIVASGIRQRYSFTEI